MKHSGISCSSVGFLHGSLVHWLACTLGFKCCEVFGGISCFFLVNMGVRQGCVFATSLFNTWIDWALGKVVDQCHCGTSISNTRGTNLVFADDAIILAESLVVLLPFLVQLLPLYIDLCFFLFAGRTLTYNNLHLRRVTFNTQNYAFLKLIYLIWLGKFKVSQC